MAPPSWPSALDLEIVEAFPRRQLTTIHCPPYAELLEPATAYLVRGGDGFSVATVRESDAQLIAYIFSARDEANARDLIARAFPPADAGAA